MLTSGEGQRSELHVSLWLAARPGHCTRGASREAPQWLGGGRSSTRTRSCFPRQALEVCGAKLERCREQTRNKAGQLRRQAAEWQAAQQALQQLEEQGGAVAQALREERRLRRVRHRRGRWGGGAIARV